jgi:hypothetical protein
MPVTLQLAMQLQKLRHLTVAQAAERLRLPQRDIEEACRMLALPMAHDPEPPLQGPDDGDRVAARANWPMKWRQRYEKARR